MPKTNPLTDTAVETEKPLHPTDVDRLVEQGKQLGKVADYVYDVVLVRLDNLFGNLVALRTLYDCGAMEHNKELAIAKGAIINNLFGACRDLKYECELIAELDVDELLERKDAEAHKVLQ